jgi:glycosyltransferase
MRVLFTPHVAPQHLYPLVPLAWACRAAGHEVRIAGAPVLAEAIVHTGLAGVLVGADPPAPTSEDDAVVARIYQHRPFPADWPLAPHLLDDRQREMIEVLGRRSAMAAERMVDELIAFATRWRPDLVVHDIGNFAGPVAAAVLGVPSVRHLTGVGLRPMEFRVGDAEPLPEYAALFQRRGLEVRLPTMSIDPSPPSLRLPVAQLWREVRYVPYNGPGMAPAWLDAQTDRPRVCVTWGLSVSRVRKTLSRYAVEPFALALEALAELPAEIIVTTTPGQLELLGDLPDNVRAVAGLPLNVLLPHCALIVHQAGDGTALTAAALGVPQLAVTRKPDPALTGSRLAAAGAAIHLRYQELAAAPDAHKVIRAAAEALLTEPAYREAAGRLRAEIERQPAPAALVPALETLARAGG